MAIRMSGITSGLDTESLVSALVSSYRTKTEKYTKAQTKLTWKQDAWSSLSAKTLSFRTSLDSLRFSKAYNLKTTSVSNSTKATVTASNSAVNGSQSLNITQLAKSGYLTGGKVSTSAGSAATTSTTLSELNTNGNTFGSDEGKINVNGTEITLTNDMTINSLVNKLNSAGVTASFDATNQRIFISASDSGADGDFTLIGEDSGGVEALKALGLYTSSKTATDLLDKYQTQTNSTDLDTVAQQTLSSLKDDADIINQTDSASAYLTAASDFINAAQTDGYKNVASQYSSLNATDKSFMEDGSKLVIKDGSGNCDTYYTKSTDADGATCYKGENGSVYYLYEITDDDGKTSRYLSTGKGQTPTKADDLSDRIDITDAVSSSEYLQTKYNISSSDIAQYNTAKAAFNSLKDATSNLYLNGTHDFTDKVNEAQLAIGSINLNGDFETMNFSGTDFTNAKEKIQTAQTAITDSTDRSAAQKKLDENSAIASYAKNYAKAVAKDAGSSASTNADAAVSDFKTFLQNIADASTSTVAAGANGPVRIDGQDAKIYLNGAEFTSKSNSFTINGLTINALATTTTEDRIANGYADEDAVTITTTTDTQGIYDQIKDFLSEYNSLINTMTSYYNADSSSDYEPLTDDEKEAMTDSQIEKWEEKGKSGILRRDTTLSALMNTMTNAMAKSYSYNGKNYALSSFGIKTLGILNSDKNEQNAYHIDGDEDDDSTKANDDKLMAAIIADPEGVTNFFQKLSNELYDNLGKKMTSTSLRTYGTFYNDKEMAQEYSDYTTTISKWETRLSDMEESYYKKFAAMESALTALQSNSSSLSGLLG